MHFIHAADIAHAARLLAVIALSKTIEMKIEKKKWSILEMNGSIRFYLLVSLLALFIGIRMYMGG